MQVGHASVAFDETGVLVFVVERALAFAERLRRLDHERPRLVQVGQVGGSGRAAGYGRLGGDGHAHDRRVGGGARLQDGVQVVQPVAVRRDVGHGQRICARATPGGDFHQRHEVFADAHDAALLHRGRDHEALTDDEIKAACELCIEAGIDWVKSSTGQYAGPTLEQVILMADCCKGTNTRVKVSGVKDPRPQNAYVFLRAGADLIGTRQAPQIIDSFDTMRKIGIIPPYEGE